MVLWLWWCGNGVVVVVVAELMDIFILIVIKGPG